MTKRKSDIRKGTVDRRAIYRQRLLAARVAVTYQDPQVAEYVLAAHMAADALHWATHKRFQEGGSRWNIVPPKVTP